MRRSIRSDLFCFADSPEEAAEARPLKERVLRPLLHRTVESLQACVGGGAQFMAWRIAIGWLFLLFQNARRSATRSRNRSLRFDFSVLLIDGPIRSPPAPAPVVIDFGGYRFGEVVAVRPHFFFPLFPDLRARGAQPRALRKAAGAGKLCLRRQHAARGRGASG